jgi:uncharacterized membrane protein required for colicin V production
LAYIDGSKPVKCVLPANWKRKAVGRMNWCDFVVIGIIGAFAVAGLFKGFIMSVYRLVSFVACVFLSVKLSPVLAGVLEKTALYESIKGVMVRSLEAWSRNAFSSSTAMPAGTAGAKDLLGTMKVPSVFKSSVLNNLPSPSELVDFKSIVNAVGDGLADMVLSVVSLIILYLVLRIIFGAFGILLRKIAELPLFKQVNKVGGLIFGAMQGLLTVYILFAALMLFNLNPAFAPVFEGLESSTIALGFYENNIIIGFMFPPVTA